LLCFKVGEICRADAAADGVDVKADVVCLFVGEDAQQIAAKLLPRRTREPLAPPDFAERVYARIAAAVDLRELLQEIGLRAQCALNGRHLLDRQCFVEVGFEFGSRESQGHA